MTTVALAARAYQQSFDTRPYTTLAFTNGTLSALGDAVAQAAQLLTSRTNIDNDNDSRPQYDPQRTLRFFTFGFGMGPLIGRWVKFLEHRFPFPASSSSPVSMPSSFSPISAGIKLGGLGAARPLSGVGVPIGNVPKPPLLATTARVVADQLVMAPIGLALFLGSMGFMESVSSNTTPSSSSSASSPSQSHSAPTPHFPMTHHISQKFNDLYLRALLTNWQVWPAAQVLNFRYIPLAYRVPFQSTCGIFWNLYLSLLNAKGNEVEEQRERVHEQDIGQKQKEKATLDAA